MTLTIANIPLELDAALRQKAAEQSKPIDQVVLEVIRLGLGMAAPTKARDLSDLAGTWVEDPEFDTAMKDQDAIDPEAWR